MSSALAATDAQNLTGGSAIDALQYGTSLSGFATAAVTEGTVANYRPFDLQLIAPTSQYVHQGPLGREPFAAASTFVRCRVTAAASVNAYIYVIFGQN
jgi:hypothetical protein